MPSRRSCGNPGGPVPALGRNHRRRLEARAGCCEQCLQPHAEPVFCRFLCRSTMHVLRLNLDIPIPIQAPPNPCRHYSSSGRGQAALSGAPIGPTWIGASTLTRSGGSLPCRSNSGSGGECARCMASLAGRLPCCKDQVPRGLGPVHRSHGAAQDG